jgi:uncharacterized protein
MPPSFFSAAGRMPWAEPYHVMAKPMGARCNLACKYCFYLEKEPALYPGAGVPRMSAETAERFIRDYLASQPGEEVHFAWQGGEPTLAGLDFFRQVVSWQKHYAGGRKVVNALQTNGTLLDAEWAAFLRDEGFLVGISVDGPRELHDGYRVDRGGRPTWEKVMRGLRALRKAGVEFNTLTVVHRRNVRRAEQVYEFLRAEGSGWMQFIPLVELNPEPRERAAGLDHGMPTARGLIPREKVGEAMAEECPTPEAWGDFLCKIFDLWLRRDVGKVFVQTIEGALSVHAGRGPTMCVFAERCGRALALEHNGDVYACDHYVYPAHRHGNLRETPLADLANGAAARAFGAAKAELPRVCVECPVKAWCNGDCPKHRFVDAGEGLGGRGVSYLCAGYRKFFTHSAPALRRIAAEVMAGMWR